MNNLKTIASVILLSTSSTNLFAGGIDDDPLLYKVMIDQLETREKDGENPLILETDVWIGKDLNKAWFKIDAEQVDGELEELEMQALYSKAIAPFWDLQVGWKHNSKPKPQRDWFAIGVKGLAPYQFEVDAALFFGGNGQMAARLSAEYEYMFTQKLVLSPETVINLYSKDDSEHGIGSGLSDLQLGLRLRYEVTREFSPYIGVNWNRKFGKTEDYAVSANESVDDTQIVVGVRAWY